jgi:hypothetical protein
MRNKNLPMVYNLTFPSEERNDRIMKSIQGQFFQYLGLETVDDFLIVSKIQKEQSPK